MRLRSPIPHRHFDPFEPEIRADIGCKYCECIDFEPSEIDRKDMVMTEFKDQAAIVITNVDDTVFVQVMGESDTLTHNIANVMKSHFGSLCNESGNAGWRLAVAAMLHNTPNLIGDTKES